MRGSPNFGPEFPGTFLRGFRRFASELRSRFQKQDIWNDLSSLESGLELIQEQRLYKNEGRAEAARVGFRDLLKHFLEESCPHLP